MFKTLKSSLIVGGILVALIVIIVGGLQLASHRMHENPQATLMFATTAKALHDKLKPATLDNITVLANRIANAGAGSDNLTDIQYGITSGQLAASAYRESYGYLQPTSDTVDLYTALQQEASAIATCYTKLTEALSYLEAGNQALADARLQDARAARDQAISLRQQNTTALDNLIAVTQAKLAK